MGSLQKIETKWHNSIDVWRGLNLYFVFMRVLSERWNLNLVLAWQERCDTRKVKNEKSQEDETTYKVPKTGTERMSCS